MKRVKILKYFINPIKKNVLLKKIINWCKNKKLKSSKYICVSSVHGASESVFNKKYRKSHNNCDLALADGRPIYWALKLFDYKEATHLPGYEVTKILCNFAAKEKLNVGFYGGEINSLNGCVLNLQNKYQGLKINYVYSPPFRDLTKEEKEFLFKQSN